MRRIVRLGLFDAAYHRNRTTAAALSVAGAVFRDVHFPVLETIGDRLAPSRDAAALLAMAWRFALGEMRLAPRACSAIVWAQDLLFGYPGHWDIVGWAPLARRLGRRVLFDPLVTLTETFIEDRRLVAPGTVRARLIRWLDRLALRAADVILADTPQQAASWAALAGVPLSRFAVLPVGADERLFDPARRMQAGGRGDDLECLRVLFYGTYSPLHGAETIVEAVHRLERAGERLAVVMIGTGQCEAAVRARAAEAGLRTIIFVPWVPEHELPNWIAWADVVLGIFGATAKAARVVPNKVYQAMAMASTIVTRDSPALRWLADGEEIALLVPPADADALAAALRTLRSPARRTVLAQAARARFEAVASDRARASRLRPLLDPSRPETGGARP